MSILRAEAVRNALRCDNGRCDCQKSKGNVHCPTPAHVDSNPSCSLDEKNGNLLIHCFVCSQEEVWEALESIMETEQVSSNDTTGTTYWYTDKDFNKLFCVERYYDSGGRKRFRQSHICKGKLTAGMGGDCGCDEVPRVLYNMPVISAMETNEVFWVEGEKDVTTLQRHNAVATCTPQGASAFDRCLVSNPNLLEPMTGKVVYVIADNDLAGSRYAREVSDRLMHYANQVWMVSFDDDYEQGYDISDYLSTSGNDFRKWIDANKVKVYDSGNSGDSLDVLPPYSVDDVGDISMVFKRSPKTHIEAVVSDLVPEKGSLHGSVAAYNVTTNTGRKSTILPKTDVVFGRASSQDSIIKALTKRNKSVDWMYVVDKLAIAVDSTVQSYGKVVDVTDVDTTTTMRKWLLEPILAHDEHVAIFAQGGVGKSMFAGACALSLATGIGIVPGVTPKSKGVPTLYLDWEDDEVAYASRINRMLNAYITEDIPTNKLKYMSMKYPMNDSINQIRREVDKHGIEMVVVDSVALACGGDITNSTVATRYLNLVRSLGCAVLSITHISKMAIWVGSKDDDNDPMPIGSVFFVNGPRATFFLVGDHNTESDSKEMLLMQTKSNTGPASTPISYKAYFDNDNEMITFEQMIPFENPKLRGYCKKVDVIDHYIKEVDRTVDELDELIPEYKTKEIEYQLNYFNGKRFELLEGGYWRSLSREDAYDW